MAKTYADYRSELYAMVAAGEDPDLTAIELDQCLANSRVADHMGYPPDSYRNWTPNTQVPPGVYIVPTTRDGYVYYSALGGLTGAVEPLSWGASTVDNTVTWTRYAYAPWGGTYDLNRAASAAWELKAAKAANRKNVSAFGQTNSRTSTYDHCLQMAQLYRDKIVESIPLQGAIRRRVY